MTLGWRTKLPCDIVMSNDERKEVDDVLKDLNTYLMYDLRQGISPSVGYALSDEDISCDLVFPNLYLGGMNAAMNKKYLRRTGITHVVNTAMGDTFGQVKVDASYYDRMRIKFIGFELQDLPNCDISQYFGEASDFIDKGLISGGKVLVHCMMGISRSATVVCAFLMLKRGFAAAGALQLVRSRRLVYPNPGFLRRLAVLDVKLRKERENRDRQQRVILWGSRARPSSCDRPYNNERRGDCDRRSSYDELTNHLVSHDRHSYDSSPYDHYHDNIYNRSYGHDFINSYDRLKSYRTEELRRYPSLLPRQDDISHRRRWAGSLPTSYLMSLRRNK